MANLTGIGTISLTGAIFTITVNMGITAIALRFVSGTVTYQGSLAISTSGGIVQSSAIGLNKDNPTFEATGEYPFDGFIIDASAGVCEIDFTQG